MTYHVIEACSAKDLEEQVNAVLEQGATLVGGPAVTGRADPYLFIQVYTIEDES